jgi:hypothetical protein
VSMNKERCKSVDLGPFARVWKAARDNHRAVMKVRRGLDAEWLRGRRGMALTILHAALGRRDVPRRLL